MFKVDVRAELDVKDSDSSIQEKNVWEEEQRWGSVSKLINTLGSLEGLPSLSLYTGALANITN